MTTSDDLSALAAGFDQRVRDQQISLLYAQAPFSAASGLILAPALTLLVLHLFPTGPLLTWFCILETVYLARLVLSVAFQQRARTDALETWLPAYVAISGATGAAWGGGVLLLAQSSGPTQDLLLLLILSAILLGAIFTLSASLTAYVCYALPLSLPSILWLMLQADPTRVAMGAAGVVYLLLALTTAWRLHQVLLNSLCLAAENLTLAQAFAHAKEQAETSNRKLVQQRLALRRCVQAMRELHQVISMPHRHASERIEALLALGCTRLDLPIGLLGQVSADNHLVTHRLIPESVVGVAEAIIDAAAQYNHEVVQRQAALGFTDIANRPTLATILPQTALAAYLGAPVRRGSQICGVLSFMSPQPRRAPFTAVDCSLMELMAQWVGGVLEQDQMAATAQRQQMLLSHASRLHSLGEMAAGLVHEINQPLTAMALYAEAGLDQSRCQALDPDQAREVLEKILGQSARATALVQRIRHFARQSRPDYVTVQINTILADLADFLRLETRRHRVELHCVIAPALPPVRADVLQVQQVVLNLVHNALEAMSGATGASKSLILISAQVVDAEVRVAVRDHGSGLAAGALEAFPRSFFTTKPSGLGLGLAISQSIIEAHGGRLWATANPDSPGTTFWFTLPIVTANVSTNVAF